MLAKLKSVVQGLQLPAAAKNQRSLDRRFKGAPDPGPDAAIRASGEWLLRAQLMSASRDGGVARDFSLVKGWATSYPETTGYIVPTMFELADYLQDQRYEESARRMLDWLVAIQLPDGGFQGGKIDASPVVPVTFNTGQILIGLASGVARGGAYHDAARAAGRFLADSLDEDGCWRSHPTPFAAPGEKAYETHVAWGLFQAERVLPGEGFGEAGLKQVRWAIGKQQANGWIADCCLNHPDRPLTHTLGYALRGIVEAYRLYPEADLLEAAMHTARGLQSAVSEDGYLPGRLDGRWRPAVDWCCQTGTVQVAHSFLLLAQITGEQDLTESARMMNAYVRRRIQLEGNPDLCGGVKGSFPVDGDYGTYEYLNWAAKFSIDSNLCELGIGAGDA